MFPNPQDALPLPPYPSLDRYRKLAKDLVKACKSDEPESIRRWAKEWVETLVKLSSLTITPHLPVDPQRWTNQVEDIARRKLSGTESNGRKCALTDAQFVIARSHGFESWPKFAKHLLALDQNTSVSKFEAAAEAIVAGDAAALRQLLDEQPNLVRVRSTREHGATLLHYVSANGIEGYRQKTPQNIVEITRILMQAGAEIDATANVYGGGATTLGLAATSLHPERAGVQEDLLRTLLEYGAKIDPPLGAANRQSIVMACLANGRPKAAKFLAGNGARLDLASAAALGRLDLVEPYFTGNGTLKPDATQEQMNEGFVYACEYGRRAVVEFLIEKGADPATNGGTGQTALHMAVIGGHLEIVKLLLKHGAPLETENVYGGTALGQALWSAAHGGDPDLYVAILGTLVAAGAKLPKRHEPVNSKVDEWLAVISRRG
jgi:ankyrin repeat protein